MQRHLSSRVLQPSHPEMGCTHPGLERAERVLECKASDAHQVGIALHPIIHLVDQMFVLPAGDAALLAGRTARLERAILTIILPVTPMHQASLFAGIAVGQLPSGRAGVAINLGVVDKSAFTCMPFLRLPEVSGLGTVAVMPSFSQASISTPLK